MGHNYYLSACLRRSSRQGVLGEPRIAAAKLGYRNATRLTTWLGGRLLPPIEVVPKLAEIAGIKPSTMLLLWLADTCPEHVEILRAMAVRLIGNEAEVALLFEGV